MGRGLVARPARVDDGERVVFLQVGTGAMSAGNPSHMLPSGGFFDNWLILFEQVRAFRSGNARAGRAAPVCAGDPFLRARGPRGMP